MNKVCKAMLGVSTVALCATAALTPVLVQAWGDSSNGRKTYTLDQINNGDLGKTITFNSISNGQIGDERYFVGAKVAGAKVDTWNNNTIDVKDGETYTIRLYVHNNNPEGEKAIAKDVTATFSIPTTVSNSQTIVGYLDSSNATPNRYWDEVTLKASENVYLEYVKGSARYDNKKGSFQIPDAVVSSGAKLGYTSMNGEIPGCYPYAGVLTIDVKVHKSVAAKLAKQVRIKGTENWSESVNAKVGDEVEYRIEYVNYLSEQVKNVMIRDILPDNVEYVKGSTYLINSNHRDGINITSTDTIVTSGLNIGDYNARGNAYVQFTGKIVDKNLACGGNQLVNWANVTVNSSTLNGEVYKDDASVMVDKTCKTPDNPTNPDTPKTPEKKTVTTYTAATPTTETTSTIVNTGAGEIVTGAVGAGSVVTTLGYYIASRKKLM